jgi:class 3 adenylate cyclase
VFKTPFYSLGWASEYLNFDYFLTSLGKAVQLFFYPLKMMFVLPAILIEGIFWMAGTYVCSLLLGNQTSFSRVAAFPAAAAVLCAGQWLAFRLAPDHIPFNLAHFAAGLFLMGVPAFILHRLQEPFGVDSLALPHDRAAAPERPKGGLKDLSLKETIMMQVLLKDHMESFSRELTLLNIDVAESGRIKKHEDPANVIYSFDCYHKFADGICINRGGTVLDRAGDGIIYAFDSPGEAVKAAAEIQQGLPAFNRNVSRLKNIFKVRIGVHTGQIIMDRGTERGKFFSNTVDISGHLQKEAPVGEVFISGATYRALEEEKKSFVFAKRLARDNIDVYRYAGFAGD